MQKTITRAVVGIEALIDHIGKLTAWLALAMISLVAVNVLLRYAFSLGSVWAQELEWHLLAALILLGMSHALQRGDNVRVDLFYVRYGTRTTFVVDVVSVLLIMVVALLFVALSLGYVGQSYAINEQSPDPGGIPFRWVVKGLIPLGYCLLVLQSAGQLMRIVQTYRAPGELDDV
ncbi:MAG: TRAP transporter small permease subunit [Rhodoferax sp.]|uniref:TRAP transporter small permease subunit n=1 Tax=Rhodoferax sp. TaxID=50421 RepID=UPI0008C8FD7F|nr:TRAP transporter small permease subunit [Rhodoferax sp.]MDP2677622.1 TRAP transporter small permease subunit [Rhodoferax sp.]OGB50714.1 MAG: C4-dicarboxylate ABC transporter permease [Burkholderiales bacterium RIFOXYD12_FULL_59_19]OGB79353.1 MAG: C4-dicarboxylate ABC transporter permease [Burkholderiales bacterium RIFOXYC12_FULL_60_6]OGB81684.1 MAG: C4-dicarboxylate ABC transporter permease [Burkholderiales bacterium RIFOXYD2_FULL_59_8]